MKKSNRLHTSEMLPTSVNFLFENKKATYIIQKEKTFIDKKSFYYDSFVTGSDKERVYKHLKKNNFFDQKYKFLDVSLLNDTFTLIPIECFEESTAEKILNFNVPYLKNMGVRFNLIPQFNLVIVFYYPEIIEELFKGSSEKLRITHTGFKFLSKIESNHHTNGYFIQVYDTYFEVAIIENGRLILYNIYPFKIIEDIQYFLQIISETLEKRQSFFTLYYYNIVGKEKILHALHKKFRDVVPGLENDFERENYTILDV